MAVDTYIELESTLTDRYQTTVPRTVRKALKLGKRDKVRYTIQNGQVLLTRAEPQEKNDPVLEHFLHFLAQNMLENPQQVAVINSNLMAQAQALVTDVAFDLEAPLLPEDD